MQIGNKRKWAPILLCLLLGGIAGGCSKTTLPPVFVPSRGSDEDVAQDRKGREQEDPPPVAPDSELDRVLHQFQKGIGLLERGKAGEARSIFEGLRHRYPEVSVIHNNLGVTYKRLGRLEEAAQSYQKAIDLQGGGYTEAHYNLAIVFREQGAFRKAEAVYKKVISLNPEFQDAHYNLAVLFDLYLNDPAEALRHYRKYMELAAGDHEKIELWIAALQKRLPESGSGK